MKSASLSRGENFGILPVFFSLGLFALFCQTVFLRELMVVAWGNELVFGIGLGQWLAGVCFGAWAGSRMTEKTGRSFSIFVLMLILVNLFGVAGVVWIRGMLLISGVIPGASIGYGQVFFLALWPFMLVGFAVGFSFPVAVSLQLSGSPMDTTGVFPASMVYIVEGAGVFVGSLLFTFLMAGKIRSMAVFGWGGLILFLPLLAGKGRKWFVRGVALLMLFLNLLLLLAPGRVLSDWTIALRWRGISSSKLVFSDDSRFQSIEVGKQGGQYQFFEGGRFSFSFPDNSAQKVLAAQLMAQHPGPKQVLVLGTVMDGLGQELLRYPVTRLDSVELDPKVAKQLYRFNQPIAEKIRKDSRFHEIIGDGRRFVRNLARSGTQKYDLVYINQPEPVSTLLNRFYTVEFFRDLSRILSPGGVVSMKMASTVNYTSGELGAAAKTLVATVRAVFPQIVVCPESPHMIFASKSRESVSADPSELAARYSSFKLKPLIMALMFRSLYPAERTEKLRHVLLAKPGSTRLNSDIAPVLSARIACLTGWYSGSRMATLLEWLQQMPWFWGVLLLAFWVIALPLAGKPRIPVLLVTGVVGFTAMALELVVIYGFQSSVGMVYGKIGLLIGIFMTGLPLGAGWSDRFLRKATAFGGGKYLLRQALLLIIVVVAVFLLLEWERVALSAVFFYLLMGTDGFLAGMVFPAAVAAIRDSNSPLTSAAGRVDAADHGGGAIGAILTGGFLVLLLGIPVTLLLLLALNAFALYLVTGDR